MATNGANKVPFIGIDFGTSKCTVAWINPRTRRAELIRNAEGHEKTPSVVYFGDSDTLVGEYAEQMLENEAERGRVVMSIKRDMVFTPSLSLPGGKRIRAVAVAAEIFRKLKCDAEQLHFHAPVTRAVVTVPAAFDALQRERIEEAAKLAGFNDVRLLEEPVAAAIAYSRAGLTVGQHVLVYDLGAGTFDLAVLANDEDGGFRLVMESRGVARLGGDDFDRALYDYCDEVATRELGRGITLDGRVDLQFLALCRKRKENLSVQERSSFSNLLMGDNGSGPVRFQQIIERSVFEGLIEEKVGTTARLTERVVQEAGTRGHKVDTVVMVGGSSRVPLVERMLKGKLPVEPKSWAERDMAVALGAAYYAETIWAQETGRELYLQAVKQTSTKGRLDHEDVERLAKLAREIRLDEGTAAAIEREVLGDLKERIYKRQLDAQREQYRQAVRVVWEDKRLTSAEVTQLSTLVQNLGLDQAQAASIENEIMGGTKDEMLEWSKPKLRIPELMAKVDDLGNGFPVHTVTTIQTLMKAERNWQDKLQPTLRSSIAAYSQAVLGEVEAELRNIGVDRAPFGFDLQVDLKVEVVKRRSTLGRFILGIVSIAIGVITGWIGVSAGEYSYLPLYPGEVWIAAVGMIATGLPVTVGLYRLLHRTMPDSALRYWLSPVVGILVAVVAGVCLVVVQFLAGLNEYSFDNDLSIYYDEYGLSYPAILVVTLAAIPFTFWVLHWIVPSGASKELTLARVREAALSVLPQLKSEGASYVKQVAHVLLNS
jgi:molecular chaperone DnaK (HSP70)